MRTQETMWGTLSPAQPWAQCCKAKGSQKQKQKTILILQSLGPGCGATHQNSDAARTDFTRFEGRRVVVNSWYAERMKMEPILLFLGKRIVLRTHIH